MADKHKLLKQLKNGPNNVRSNVLAKAMRLWGCESRPTKDGVKFSHACLPGPIFVAFHKEKGQENKVFKTYVLKCIKAIEEIKLLEEEKDVNDRTEE